MIDRVVCATVLAVTPFGSAGALAEPTAAFALARIETAPAAMDTPRECPDSIATQPTQKTVRCRSISPGARTDPAIS